MNFLIKFTPWARRRLTPVVSLRLGDQFRRPSTERFHSSRHSDPSQSRHRLNQIRNAFDVVPDVPASSFELTLDGGADGLPVNSQDICKSKQARKVSIDMAAHNEMSTSRKPLIGSACDFLNKKKAAKLEAKAKKLLRKAKRTGSASRRES